MHRAKLRQPDGLHRVGLAALLLAALWCLFCAEAATPTPSSLVEEMLDAGFVVESAPLVLPAGRHRTWLGIGLSGGRLGSSVAAGDVDGDGFPELYLGARRGLVSRNNAGLVVGIPGSSQGPSWEGARILLGEKVQQRLGSQLAVGRVGMMPTALWMIEGNSNEGGSVRRVDLLGNTPKAEVVVPLDNWPVPDSLCILGDVDGDGRSDFLVGSSRASKHANEAGEVRLFGGSEPNIPPRLLWTQSGNQEQERLGYCLRSLGDFDRDGFADFAIGSPGHGTDGRPKAGRVVVYRGGTSDPVPHWEFVGTEAHLRLGVRFDAGDLDGDGNADLALGAPGIEGEMDGVQPTGDERKVPGRVFLFRSVGSSWPKEADLTIPGPGGGRSFGASVAIVPNHFAGGRAALFVGAPMTTARFRNEGRVQSFPGHPKLLVAPSDREWLGNQGGTQFGTFVTAIGDLDGDGFQEVAFGSPFGYAQGRQGGRVDVWFGGGPRAQPHERLLAVNSKEKVASLIPKAEQDQSLRWEGRQVILGGSVAGTSVLAIVGGILWLWKKRQAVQTEEALRAERDRIARIVHDGLGSEAVRLAAMVESVGKSESGDKSPEMLKAIAASARQVMRTVDEAVWVTKPAEDSLEALLGFLMDSATEYFSKTRIGLRQIVPPEVPDVEVVPLERINILFIVKEAFANALKHSDAATVNFTASVEQSMLKLTVQDDGKGFRAKQSLPKEESQADGLRNMNTRAREIGAELSIVSGAYGTTVCLTWPLSSAQRRK